MRLVRYQADGASRVGIESVEGIFPTRFSDTIELIRSGGQPEPSSNPVRPERLLAPIGRPGKIFGSGINFRGHLDENPDGVLPTKPGFFSKLPSSVIGPDEEIVIPAPERQLDFEVEVGIVVGAAARSVPRERALEHVFGYTVLNDVSARDLQFGGGDIVLGKGLDTFCPMGPRLVTVDELGDAAGLRLATYLNGVQMQEGNTSDWLFDVATLIEFLSSYLTLEPGDVITTGTPAGVGFFREPQVFMQPGDRVRVEVDRIGALENDVISGW